MYFQEHYTEEERRILLQFFTNVDKPVFALVNMPEVVKGTLFARYSRTHKPLRRLFLDEFVNYSGAKVSEDSLLSSTGYGGLQMPLPLWNSSIVKEEKIDSVKTERAEDFYKRILSGYGDDSIAQLGGAHIACEQASNLLTKSLEWGRLAAYLEQSTRYIFYDRKTEDRYRYVVPPEIIGGPVEGEYRYVMDGLFSAYSEVVHASQNYFLQNLTPPPQQQTRAWKASIRAKACDVARGILPASSMSNLGIFATGQAFEMMLIRMKAHPLREVRECGEMMLEELRIVIPAFMQRVDAAGRGELWAQYIADTTEKVQEAALQMTDTDVRDTPEVSLTEWDTEAETKVAAAALYAVSDLPKSQLMSIARRMTEDERHRIIRMYCGDRKNRRHKPGRALEYATYTFDILSDYGSFRDLQRHRMLTIEWQRLSTKHGCILPPPVLEVIGKVDLWRKSMEDAAKLWETLDEQYGPHVAQYAVPFAYKMRYSMRMNAREAMHMLELRTSRQGHTDYRRICLEMHRLIRDVAGHTSIADVMKFIDETKEWDLPRVSAERVVSRRIKS